MHHVLCMTALDESTQQLSLHEAATHLLEECRMVLPGIQALFGFQTVAVFSQRFATELSRAEQWLHLVAILSVVAGIALVMAPAAIHRRCEPRSISSQFLSLCSRLLMWSMAPLAVGTTLDVYIVGRVLTQSVAIACACAAISLLLFLAFWIVVPEHLLHKRVIR